MARACPECGNVTLDKTETVCRHCDAPLDGPAAASASATPASPRAAAAPSALPSIAPSTCPGCGTAIADRAQAFCGRCGTPLTASARVAAPSTAGDDRPAPGTVADVWESFKTVSGAIYGLILFGIGMVVIVYGCYALVVGPPPKPDVPAAPQEPARPSVSAFEVTPVPRRLLTEPRQISVKYLGTEPLTDVVIEIDLRFIDRTESKGKAQFATWKPGESQTLDVASGGLAVHYSWHGTARRNAEEVTLYGTSGDM
jgi:predicted RNA-binding Zn-ribbon protein involved in translation (DUF1610 family)